MNTETEPAIVPEDLDVAVTIYREHHDEYEILRGFSASVEYSGLDVREPVQIGSVQGWICWDMYKGKLSNAGNAVGSDALDLTFAVERIVESDDIDWVDAAVMIDRMWLDPKWRGHRLSGVVIENLTDLLQLDPTQTIVVLHPEPQRPDEGGPYADGPERDAAMAKLQAAYRASGFEPWDGSPVWWRPVEG